MNINATSEQIEVIVGAGLAGGNAAVTLREEGWRGRIRLSEAALADDRVDLWSLNPAPL